MEAFFLMVVKSPGYIFGPLMLLAGLAAIGACVWATRRSDRTAARRALKWSLLPPAVGVVGALVGAVVALISGFSADRWANAAPYLLCTILFGVFVAIVPALWAFVLLRRQPPILA